MSQNSPPFERTHSALDIKDDTQKPASPTEADDKQKDRVRAFTGAFVVMISPVLLAIVLKKVNLTGAGKYQGRIGMLEAFVDLVQRRFPHLAAVTLLMGILPFLCVMISEACHSLPPLSYVAPRLKAATKVLLFMANVFLMVLGCGILLLLHKNALLIIAFCSILVISVIVMNIITMVYWSCCATGTEDNTENYSELEHLLEFSSGITVMMFLVLECVALEGLLRNSQPLAPPPESPTAKGQEETFLGATLLISFVATAFGVTLMNVWTTPHVKSKIKDVTLTETLPWCLNFILHAVPVAAVVVLITLEALPQAMKPAVWLPFLFPVIVLLVLLARCTCDEKQNKEEDSLNKKEQGEAGSGGQVQMVPPAAQVSEIDGASSSNPGNKAQQPKVEDQKQPTDKPAPLELTKVAFTGFLAVAVPSVTNASVSIPSIVFVLSIASTVLLGLLWRLLTTHKTEPATYVLKAANQASFSAHLFILIAGVAFWVMAVNVPN